MSFGAGSTMARPKKGIKGTPPEPSPEDRAAIIHLKGTVAYARWLDAIHRKTHIPKASLFRLAMAEWAKANGHPEPPEF